MRRLFFKPFEIAGLHYAVRIFIGSFIAWVWMAHIQDINPLWAVISVIIVTEPQMKTAWSSFISRGINTAVGCVVGLAGLYMLGTQSWMLPVVATLTALISIHIMHSQMGWRVGPVTAVLVMSASISEHSTVGAMHLALQRALGVFAGSVLALLVTWVMSKIWMPPETQAEPPAGTKSSGD